MGSRASRIALVVALGSVVGGLLGVFLVAPLTAPLFTAQAAGEPPVEDWREAPLPPAPTAPALVSPGDQAVVFGTTPTLEWRPSDSTLPLIYAVEISEDPFFSQVPIVGSPSVERLVGIEGTSIVVPKDVALTPGVPVYWRVQSLDVRLQESPWSETWSFIPVPDGANVTASGTLAIPVALH